MSTQQIVVGGLALVLAAGAQAGVGPAPVGGAQRLDPARVAGARLKPGGGWERTTPWVPYNGAGNDAQDTLVYDSLDIGGGEGGCQDGGYFFKDGAGKIMNVPTAISNMTVADEFRGVTSGRAEVMYYWTDTGDVFYIGIFTAEDVSTDCSLPVGDNFYDGVLFGFDATSTGFYYTDADTAADGLFYTMPADGKGGFYMTFGVSGPCDPEPCTFGPAQFYLYGTSNNGGSPGRPGESSDPTWADFDASGDFDPKTECVSLAGQNLCPDPPTLGITFWTEGEGPGCYADCNGDASPDLFDFLCFTNDFNGGGEYSDCNGDGLHDLFDFLCFVNAFNNGC